ncbi:MAG: flavodoxin-dependent (E)-4-hydroxy-3-methylbut-2-enyl-diphosphate synthase [Lentisphaeria bacterium]|nr:flavodoxin-dependent (E)-4-hydroxy-3-methylbut-2-enyl-diphosphate synthase [Lentisphaeria bacterium]
MPNRNQTRRIHLGNIPIGGGAPVSVQSMTNVPTADVAAALHQIKALADAGCDIVRLAIPDMTAAAALKEIVKDSPVPLVADIHFDARLAVESIKNGVHGVRINPGNIGGEEKVRMVVEAAGNAGIPIRAGANGGSLPKGLLDSFMAKGMSHSEALAEALCHAAMEQVKLLESYDFHAIKVSMKASNVPVTVAACRKFAQRSDCPLHLGITEAGTEYNAICKSAAGIGALLLDGLGDTIRVSITGDPVKEVRAAISILESCGLRDAMPELVSCPTCGRTKYDMISLADKVETYIRKQKSKGIRYSIRKVAVMGCAVNGPGEAADAELGIAGGPPGKLLLFRNGVITETIAEEDAMRRLEEELTGYQIR